MTKTRISGRAMVTAVLTAGLGASLWTIACGGGGGTPTTPSTGGGVGATVTLTANGVSDGTPRISVGQRIRFTNSDSRTHEVLTTPHLVHTDCPAVNDIGTLAPGQSKESSALTTVRGCGFHDHLNPDDNRFRGQVLVGIGQNDPIPPNPGYVQTDRP